MAHQSSESGTFLVHQRLLCWLCIRGWAGAQRMYCFNREAQPQLPTLEEPLTTNTHPWTLTNAGLLRVLQQ